MFDPDLSLILDGFHFCNISICKCIKRVGEETSFRGAPRTSDVIHSFIHCIGLRISISVRFAEVRY